MSNKDENEQEKITKITNEAMYKQKEYARKRKLQGIYGAVATEVRKNEQRKLKKEQEGAHKHFAKMEETRKQPRSNQTYHVGSVASWMMESEDRFKTIIKFLIHRFKVLRKEKFGVHARSATAGYGTWAANWLYEKAFGEYELENPDLRYSVELGDHGELYAEWLEESFGDMFLDEEGNYNKAEAGEINALLQDAMQLWIESLDGTDPDEPEGYFIAKIGDNPVNSVVYPKSAGKEVNGKWVLDEDKVREHYNEDQLERNGDGDIVPKLKATPKDDKEHLYISRHKFAEMVEGFGNPARSLEGFVASLFPDTDMQLEPPSTDFRPK